MISEAERNRRAEIIRDSRAALQQGKSLEERTRKREAKADAWTAWLRQRMDLDGADPVQLLAGCPRSIGNR
jgi:hypothetical protein